MAQRIVVDPVTRIEGHARIALDLDDSGRVTRGHLHVLEIRGMEKLLQGTELFKMPQITARICGVCPAAHHLAAVTAIENGLGVTPPKDAKLLRELLYAGHVLHSHALAVFVLSGPDLLMGIGAEPSKRSIFALLGLDPELAKKALRLRSIGQKTVEMIGGRGVHPVSAIPGGMAFRPDAEKLATIAGWGAEAVALLEGVIPALRARIALLEDLREALHLPFYSVALSKGSQFTLLDGDLTVADVAGARVKSYPQADYAKALVEEVVPSSYMKSVRLREAGGGHYFVGPLARLNLADTMPTPKANTALAEYHAKGRPRLSALDFIEARLVEMLSCAERIQAIAGGELGKGEIRVPAEPKAGHYVGIVESARGILVHDYTADDTGRVVALNLIVATQNNYEAIDTAITGAARHFLPAKDDNLLLNGVEFALRCFDPCLSCATHAVGQMPLEIELRRNGVVERVVSRRAER
jgi:F420-non-reducing hydrogenase large subunit